MQKIKLFCFLDDLLLAIANVADVAHHDHVASTRGSVRLCYIINIRYYDLCITYKPKQLHFLHRIHLNLVPPLKKESIRE